MGGQYGNFERYCINDYGTFSTSTQSHFFTKIRHCLFQFTQNKSHRRYLFKTYPKGLIYCSPTSTFWGVGLSKGEKESLDPTKWKGANKLGDLLTKVRDEMMLDPDMAFLPVAGPALRGKKRAVTEVVDENADPETEPPHPPLVRQNAIHGRP